METRTIRRAEEALLGSILLFPNLLDSLHELRASHFHSFDLREVYEVLNDVHIPGRLSLDLDAKAGGRY